jgi:EAL and modified HD-GYP domain-containing signal transduction protein
MTPTLLARQPILDQDGRVRGHELAFQDGAAQPSERATARLLLAGMAEHELPELTGGLPAWIKVSREFLLTFDPLPLAPGSVVLELESDPPVDDALLKRLRGLREEGHPVALDDFLPRTAIEPLLPFATYVKIDLAAYGLAGLRAVLDRLPYERPAVVATNVAMPSQRDACVRRGVELLQGFWFERPRQVERTVPVTSVDRLRTVIALRRSPGFEDVENVIAGDPGLTLRLLRFANSAAIGSRRRFSSVREALVLLGSERVRQFALLVLLSDLGHGRPALVSAALLRGRLCEALARERGDADPDTAFTAGVLSIVDALLDQKLFDVLKGLPVSEELRWALLGRSGPVGVVLDTAIRLEQSRAGADAARFTQLSAVVTWADTALAELV